MIYSRNVGKVRGMQTLTARFMGPIWGPPGADRTQMGPMLAPWTLLSGKLNWGEIIPNSTAMYFCCTLLLLWEYICKPVLYPMHTLIQYLSFHIYRVIHVQPEKWPRGDSPYIVKTDMGPTLCKAPIGSVWRDNWFYMRHFSIPLGLKYLIETNNSILTIT